MINVFACDKNSSDTVCRSINPQTKEEFDKNIKDFEEFADTNFSRWFYAFDTIEATEEQEKWCDELEGF